MSDSDTPYTSIKRKGPGNRSNKKKTRSSGPLEDEDDAPTPRSLRKRTSSKNENGDSIEFGDKPRSKRRKLFHLVFKSHIKSLCEFLLKGLLEHEFAAPFSTPVDTVKYPTYLDKVKEPMDFSTIKRKMDKDTYTEAEDFAMDVRLIFKNCMAFNDNESDLVFMAQALRKLFEDVYIEVKKREKRLLEDVEFDEMKKLIEDLKNEHQRMLNELQRLVNVASPKAVNGTAAPEPPKKEKKPKRPWDFKRKEDLSRIISSLNEPQSASLVQYVSVLIPASFATGELELDLENESDRNLSKIEKFIRKTLKPVDSNGHVDIDGSSSDSSSDEKKNIKQSTEQVPIVEQAKPTELSNPEETSSTSREEKDKKDDKPPELESELHPISSKTTIVQTTTEEKNEDISDISLPKKEPADMMQIDNAQVETATEQKAVESEPRATEMTDATITTS